MKYCSAIQEHTRIVFLVLFTAVVIVAIFSQARICRFVATIKRLSKINQPISYLIDGRDRKIHLKKFMVHFKASSCLITLKKKTFFSSLTRGGNLVL